MICYLSLSLARSTAISSVRSSSVGGSIRSGSSSSPSSPSVSGPNSAVGSRSRTVFAGGRQYSAAPPPLDGLPLAAAAVTGRRGAEAKALVAMGGLGFVAASSPAWEASLQVAWAGKGSLRPFWEEA